jgi:hypothetical protein
LRGLNQKLHHACNARQQVGMVSKGQPSMNNKREHQRLNELFAGIELLATNPAGDTVEIRREPENPPSVIADLEKPVSGRENDAVSIETTPAAVDPQVPQNRSDGLSLQEQDLLDYASPNDTLQALQDSTSLMPDISNATTSEAGARTMEERHIAPQSEGQWRDDKLSLTTNWQALGMGIVTGTIVTALVLAFTWQLNLFDNVGRLALTGWEILSGIIGAFVARFTGKARRAIWIESMVWSLVPILAALVFVLLLSLLMFTSFFGV